MGAKVKKSLSDKMFSTEENDRHIKDLYYEVCARLSTKIENLKTEKKDSDVLLGGLRKENSKLRRQSEKLQKQLNAVKNKKELLKKKYAGTVNQLKRLRNKYKSKTARHVATMTKVSDISSDLITVEPNTEIKKTINKSGTLFSRRFSRKRTINFATLPIFCRKDRIVKTRQRKNRALVGWEVIKHLVGSEKEKEIEKFLANLITFRENYFIKAAKIAGLNIQNKMSVSEATEMMSLLRFSTNKVRELRAVLKNTNIGNFLPSERMIRREQN